jgi:hypothetical protein
MSHFLRASLPLIATKGITETIVSHIKSLNTENTATYVDGNPDLGLGQTQTGGGIQPVSYIPNLLLDN